jgi:hypothetical protein
VVDEEAGRAEHALLEGDLAGHEVEAVDGALAGEGGAAGGGDRAGDEDVAVEVGGSLPPRVRSSRVRWVAITSSPPLLIIEVGMARHGPTGIGVLVAGEGSFSGSFIREASIVSHERGRASPWMPGGSCASSRGRG